MKVRLLNGKVQKKIDRYVGETKSLSSFLRKKKAVYPLLRGVFTSQV